MKVSDLVKELNLTVFCGEENLDTVIKGGYTSDLLSDVMGHMEEGMLWITMQTHQNIVAVSTLKDAAAVLIVNGASPDEETLQKGKDEDIPLLGTSLSAFVAVFSASVDVFEYFSAFPSSSIILSSGNI